MTQQMKKMNQEEEEEVGSIVEHEFCFLFFCINFLDKNGKKANISYVDDDKGSLIKLIANQNIPKGW